MPVELHLPDLPEVPITLGARRVRQERLPWFAQLQQWLSSYLPLLLMALLALATWWLVKNTPVLGAVENPALPSGTPDYSMQRFTLERFTPEGRLRVRLEGRELRHYPGGDRIEVDEVQVHAYAPDGRVTVATARRAVSNGDASQLTLEGGAEVTGTDVDGSAVRIRSEYLLADLQADRVSTTRPVQLDHGANQLRAAGLVYDGPGRLLELAGPVRAVLQVRTR